MDSFPRKKRSHAGYLKLKVIEACPEFFGQWVPIRGKIVERQIFDAAGLKSVSKFTRNTVPRGMGRNIVPIERPLMNAKRLEKREQWAKSTRLYLEEHFVYYWIQSNPGWTRQLVKGMGLFRTPVPHSHSSPTRRWEYNDIDIINDQPSTYAWRR